MDGPRCHWIILVELTMRCKQQPFNCRLCKAWVCKRFSTNANRRVLGKQLPLPQMRWKTTHDSRQRCMFILPAGCCIESKSIFPHHIQIRSYYAWWRLFWIPLSLPQNNSIAAERAWLPLSLDLWVLRPILAESLILCVFSPVPALLITRTCVWPAPHIVSSSMFYWVVVYQQQLLSALAARSSRAIVSFVCGFRSWISPSQGPLQDGTGG